MATDQKTKGANAGLRATCLRARLRHRIKALKREVRELEAELESTQDALSGQDLHLRRGYICTIHGPTDDWYVGDCPTLHAGSQGRTYGKASQELDYAIEAVIEAFEHWGYPLPPPDVEAKRMS